MPTLGYFGPYRVFFYSQEGTEPPHVHVRRERETAKFWLDPVALARSRGFPSHELKTIHAIIEANRERFLEAWHEHFR